MKIVTIIPLKSGLPKDDLTYFTTKDIAIGSIVSVLIKNKEFSNLGTVSDLAKKVNVPVIAVHSGSVTKTFFKLDDYVFPKNVYFEISGIQYAVILKKIYEMFGAEKIIFGSDYPFGDPRVSLAMIETLNSSKKEYNLMTKENIKKILKLK
mgnify:CR=1 FL=1